MNIFKSTPILDPVLHIAQSKGTLDPLVERSLALHTRSAERVALRKRIGKNIFTAWGNPEYRKLQGKHSITSLGESLYDYTHPITSTKRNWKDTIYNVGKDQYGRTTLDKKGLAPNIFAKTMMYGVPIGIAYPSIIKDETRSAKDKALNIGAMAGVDFTQGNLGGALFGYGAVNAVLGPK